MQEDSDFSEKDDGDDSDLEETNTHWVGSYKQNGEDHPMTFSNLQIHPENGITCNGNDENGDFEIKGTCRHKRVRFTKWYKEYAIRYKGYVDKEKQEMTGLWYFPNTKPEDSNTFVIRVEEEPSSDDDDNNSDFECEKTCYVGAYKQKGEEHSMEFTELVITKEKIIGGGQDDKGVFIIDGTVNKKRVRFVKKYTDKKMKCKGKINKAEKEIRGKWWWPN